MLCDRIIYTFVVVASIPSASGLSAMEVPTLDKLSSSFMVGLYKKDGTCAPVPELSNTPVLDAIAVSHFLAFPSRGAARRTTWHGTN